MKSKPILLFLFLVFVLIFPAPSLAQNRDPNKIYKVAILPFVIHSQENLDYLRDGINDMLTSRIIADGRIVVIERSIVERAIAEEKSMRLDEGEAMKVGMRIGADYAVLGSITKVGEYISLDARLVSITKERPPVAVHAQEKGMDNVMVKIGNFAQDIGYKILGRGTMASGPGESRGPYITHAFVPEKIKYGDILKVYIEAEDPDGEMVKIATVVDQAGTGRYPTSWVFVKPADCKHFKGYLQWNTFSSKTSTISEGTPFNLTVTVFDKFGKSNALTFPMTFESGVKRASSYQLPSPFDQKDVKKLGSIDIELRDDTIFKGAS